MQQALACDCGETISFGDNSTTICDRKPRIYFAFIMSRHDSIITVVSNLFHSTQQCHIYLSSNFQNFKLFCFQSNNKAQYMGEKELYH